AATHAKCTLHLPPAAATHAKCTLHLPPAAATHTKCTLHWRRAGVAWLLFLPGGAATCPPATTA
ncbi:MAG TPA: hypothetical protein PLP58_20400, partial [Prosthecobacter sp.]|nr:hypothetical protein [Prosthecobacter sp.]